MPRYPEEVEDVSEDELNELFPGLPKVEVKTFYYCACGRQADHCEHTSPDNTRHFLVHIIQTVRNHGQVQTA